MLVMMAKIEFPAVERRAGFILRKISGVRITNSFRQLTGRTEITLPRNIKLDIPGVGIGRNSEPVRFDRFNIKEVFKPGDPVKISLGYGDELQEEFSGYVSQVSADIPIVIKCEDEMYQLKKKPAKYSSNSATLKELLTAILPGYELDVLENAELGSIRLTNTTVAGVLIKLSESPFGLYSYFVGKKLICGKYFAANTKVPVVKFHLERNVVGTNLSYRSGADLRVKIKAVNTLLNGKKTVFEYGDPDGTLQTLPYLNITNHAKLEERVKQDYEAMKQDRLEGSITAFGIPRVLPGWKANIISAVYPDRNGTFYIEGIDKTFDQNGYRQEISLGKKVV